MKSALPSPAKRPARLVKVLSVSIGLAVAGHAPQSARAVNATWDGGAGTNLINTATNWNPDTVPGATNGDTATWDATVATDLTLVWNAVFGPGSGAAGGVNLDIAAGHTGFLTLDSGASGAGFGLGNITIANGAGAFTFGDGLNTSNVNLRAVGTAILTNNSLSTATFRSDVAIGLGGGANRIMNFTGSGNWVVNNSLTPTGAGFLTLLKDGAGTLTLTNTSNIGGLTGVAEPRNTINAGTVILGAGDISATVGVLGGFSRAARLGNTTGSLDASLLNAGFTVGNAITVQTGNSGVITLGGSAANTSTFTGNILLGSTGGVAAKDVKFAAAAGGTTTFSGVIDENVGATTNANVVIGDGTNTGIVVFSNAANAYDGTTTINGGTLRVTGTLLGAGAVLVNGGGALGGAGSITGAVTVAADSVTAGQGTIDLTNGAVGTLNLSAGLTIGGASAGQISKLKFEVLAATSDLLALGSGTFTVGAGGAPIAITNLGGISSGQTYSLLTFASGAGAGFATGSGTTVGALTLTNTNLSFGVTGALNVTATAVELVTAGAAAPATAYWSGAKGATWASNDGVGGNFTTDAGGTNFVSAYPSGATDVIFSGSGATNFTHTLGQSFAVKSVTFSGANAVTIGADGNTLTVGSGGLNVPGGVGAVTIAANLGGTGVVTNANLLTLSGNSPSFTGGVVNTGTLTFGSATALSADSPLAANAGTVNLNGNNVTVGTLSGNTGAVITNLVAGTATLTASNASDSTYDGLLQDGGAVEILALTKIGSAALTLTSANTYTGATAVTNGILRLQGTNVSAGVTTTSGGTLQLDNAANGGLASGALSLNGGTLEAVNAPRELANTTTLDTNSTVTGSQNLTLNGSLTLAANRTLTNTMTGGALLTLANTVSNSSVGAVTLTVAGTGPTIIDGSVFNGSGALSLTKDGTGPVTLTGANSYTGTTTVQNGGDVAGLTITGTNTGGGIYNVANQSFLTINSSGTVTAASLNFTAFGSVVNINAGTMNVVGAVTTTNVSNFRFLNLNGGILQVGTSVFSATTGTIVNFNGGTLASGNAAGLAFESTVATTTSNHTATVLAGGAILDTTLGNITSAALFNGTAGGAITVKGGLTFTSNITNTGVLTIQDNSIWDLGGTGGASAVFLNSSVGGLSGDGSIVNSSATDGTLTINNNTGPFTYAGNIAPVTTSRIALVKTGTGTQILSGVNTYTGLTSINNGKLSLANPAALPTGAVIDFGFSTTGSLEFATDGGDNTYIARGNSGSNFTLVSDRATAGAGINHTLGGVSGAIGFGNATVNVIAGANVTSGNAAITMGTINYTAGAPGTVILNPTTAALVLGGFVGNGNAATLNLDGTNTANEVTGPITDSTLNVSKTNTGTWTLSGAQNYGTLTTSDGITNVNGSFTGGTATVNANATTNFGASQTLAALNIGAGAVVTLTASPSFSAFGGGSGAGLSVVPEPGSIGLLLVGALGFAARRRRTA